METAIVHSKNAQESYVGLYEALGDCTLLCMIMHMLNNVVTRNVIIQMENFQMHHFDTGKHFKTDAKVPSNRLHFRHRELRVAQKVDKIYARLETYQRKSLACLGQQTGVPAPSQLVHKLCNEDCEAELNFFELVHSGVVRWRT